MVSRIDPRLLTPLALTLAACAPTLDEPSDDVDTDAGWALLAEELDGALLSITGTSAEDVWAVGAMAGDGPQVLHLDASGWTRIPTGTTGDLWWGWRPADGPTTGSFWAVGEGGQVLRREGSTWDVTSVEAGITLFGVWGAAEDDVWAVGGDVAGPLGARAFHFDGEAWTSVTLPEAAAGERALFKVWGSGSDDVWICGSGGTLLHHDGSTLSAVPSPTTRDLFTVHGLGPADVWAVGGIGSATVVHGGGAAWVEEPVDFAPDFNGVYARGADVVAVGRVGSVWQRASDATWTADARGRSTFQDLHATWLDPDGGLWAVGGQITSKPLDRGVIVYGGGASVPGYVP